MRDRSGGADVRVWGGIAYVERIQLVVLNFQDNGTGCGLTARRHIYQVPRPHVVPLFAQNLGYLFQQDRGWSGGAMVLGKLPVPGRPTNLDGSRARVYCVCSRCGWGLFGHFYSQLSFLSSFSLSLGDGPIKCEIMSQRAVKPKTNNQPTIQQDNARAHSAVLTLNCPEANGIHVLDWQALSLDLAPIEHLWDELGRRSHNRRRQPTTSTNSKPRDVMNGTTHRRYLSIGLLTP